MGRKCEYRTHHGGACGKPGPNPCREHDVEQLAHELKVSRDSLKAIEGLLSMLEAKKLPFARTVEQIKKVLSNDERSISFSRDLFDQRAKAS